jgi:hypothetical protein
VQHAVRRPPPRLARRPSLLLALALALLSSACTDVTGPPPALPPAWSAALSAADPAVSPLVDRNSGKCLDVAGGEVAAPMIVYACHGGPNQRFTLPAVGATGELRVNGGTLCVDVAGGAGVNGDRIIAWECHGGPNQRWTRTAAGELRGINGRCVDVAGARTEDGSAILLWDCHGGPNQRWDATAGPADPPRMRQVASGYLHHCALAADGRAYCWGDNYQGQLGRGFASEAGVTLPPAPVGGGLRFASLALGAYHTCGVTDAGEAYCWGANSDGRLGIGTTTGAPVTTPTAVAGGVRFASLAAEWSGTCGRAGGGELHCWGHGAAAPAPAGGGLRFASLDAGGSHRCGVAADGTAYCWGSNYYGQLGTGGVGVDAASPAPVAGGIRFAAVRGGYAHSCGHTAEGRAYCWGYNGYGELGNGTIAWDRPEVNATPREVSGSVAFAAVDPGWYRMTCGLSRDGAAYCWGYDEELPFPHAQTTPRAVGADYTQVSVGYTGACALTGAGTVACWRGLAGPAERVDFP